MWKFDLARSTAHALLVTSPAQAITSTPGVGVHPMGGYMVTFATGQIIERSLAGQFVIPQGAVRQTAAAAGGQTFVWKVAGGALARADVKLCIVDEARGVVQVTEGLAAGDEIVIGNVGLLGAGMQVQIIGVETPQRGRP